MGAYFFIYPQKGIFVHQGTKPIDPTEIYWGVSYPICRHLVNLIFNTLVEIMACWRSPPSSTTWSPNFGLGDPNSSSRYGTTISTTRLTKWRWCTTNLGKCGNSTILHSRWRYPSLDLTNNSHFLDYLGPWYREVRSRGFSTMSNPINTHGTVYLYCAKKRVWYWIVCLLLKIRSLYLHWYSSSCFLAPSKQSTIAPRNALMGWYTPKIIN